MKKPDSNPIKTVLTISVGFLALHLITHSKWTLLVSFFVGVMGILSPWISKKIEYVWSKLAVVLSYIVPNILLSLVFYLFLFPIALISRIFKKSDALHLKNNSPSLFIETNKEFDKKNFENPW